MKHFSVVFVLAVLFVVSCSKKETTATKDSTQAAKVDSSHAGVDNKPAEAAPMALSGPGAYGQKLYYSTTYGKIKVSCSSCHADGTPTTKDDRIRPAHTLAGVASRTATWNGAFKGDDLKKNAYGATMCAVMYLHKGDDMKSVMPQPDIDAMNAYFDAIKGNAGAMTSNLKIQWVTKPAIHEEDKIDQKAADAAAKAIMKLPGDPTAGKTVFDHSCAYCHSMTEKKAGPPMKKAMENPMQGAKAVRCGSDAMPFYAKDVLSDEQIANVVAYIQEQIGLTGSDLAH
jgi:mono/diheme cytochrome c family protein